MNTHKLSVQIITLFQSLGTFEAYGLILGVLFACGLGLPIPEDITLISAGIISAAGTISIEGALIAGMVGVLVGDSLLFYLGRHFGRRVFTWPIFRSLFSENRIVVAEEKIRKHGRLICFAARFMPGLRAPIYLTAGTMGVRPIVFLLTDGFAALISVPVWIFLGNWFGTNIEYVLKLAKKINSVILVVLALTIISLVVYFKFIKKKKVSSSIPLNSENNAPAASNNLKTNED